jgi:hypothetical protein
VGTTIEDSVISNANIKGPTVVEEVMKNGKKHYRYTYQGQSDKPYGERRIPEKADGSVLPSVNRPIRTVIKL